MDNINNIEIPMEIPMEIPIEIPMEIPMEIPIEIPIEIPMEIDKNMYNIIDNIANNIEIPLLNDMYCKTYKYTLNKFRESLRQAIKANKINQLEVITNDMIDNYLVNKIQTEYAPHIKKQIDKLGNIPFVEQKSPEWFRLREDMISASDAGYFLKKCGISKALDSLKIKLGLKKYVNSSAPPLMHGNTYEDVARAIYESRNKVSVFEHGIISSPTNFIGASPDGIVIKCNDSSFECQSKYGRLLEIKNPYSREIDNDVKPEYMVQILQQQYTTGLPMCDFVETTIVDKYCKNNSAFYKAYEKLDDMLNDKLDTTNLQYELRIKNKNIPWENLNKFGNEKGLVVWYQKFIAYGDIRNKYIIYPLQNQYETKIIEKWIIDTNFEQSKDGFIFKETKYWRLQVYSEKTVVYDQHKFENEYIPQLNNVWDIITICRNIQINNGNRGDCDGGGGGGGDDGDGSKNISIEKYIEDLENKKDSPFYNENKRKKKLKISSTSTSTSTSTSSIKSNIINNMQGSDEIELDF
jgi:hypothetical protein